MYLLNDWDFDRSLHFLNDNKWIYDTYYIADIRYKLYNRYSIQFKINFEMHDMKLLWCLVFVN